MRMIHKSAKVEDASIDFIIPWVDGNDPEWRKRKNAIEGNIATDTREMRYRDWELLRYWFRGVENFAPWVRTVWFICDQEPPAWLKKDHPKLRIVRHENYLPEEYRPAFSSHPIELNMYRIEGLSEQFVYFNDDMFILKPLEKTFFFRDGLPKDSALLNTIPTDHLMRRDTGGRIFTVFLNNASYINRDYDFRECLKKHPLKWLHPCYGKDLLRNVMLCAWPRLVGTVEHHLPQGYLKKSFEEAWRQDFDILDQTSRHHLRDDHDVNQWLIRIRQLMEGRFVVRKPIRNAVYTIGNDNRSIIDAISMQRHPVICINDGPINDNEYSKAKKEIQQAFESVLQKPSSFEV